MEVNIVNEVATLRRLSVGQLRLRFAALFGEATHASNRTWLTKRILWRMQALAEGDLSQTLRPDRAGGEGDRAADDNPEVETDATPLTASLNVVVIVVTFDHDAAHAFQWFHAFGVMGISSVEGRV